MRAYLVLHRVEVAAFHVHALPRLLVSVALVVISRCPAVSRYPALWCPDFPRAVGFLPPRATVRLIFHVGW